MSRNKGLYLNGEEKFGYFTSKVYSAFSGLATWKMYRQIIQDVVRNHPSRLLDVGCGPGDILVRIAGEIRDASIMGIDPSPDMVRLASRKIRKKGLSGRVSVGLGSSREPGTAEKFDMIMTSFSFHHWANREQSLSALLELLGSNGVLTIYDMNSAGLYGKMPIVRKHALSPDDIKKLQVEGFSQEVRYSSDSRLVMLSYSKKGI